MMTGNECADAWKKVIECYDATRGLKVRETAEIITTELGKKKALEVFATVARIKKHDGRISPKNRKAMECVPVNQDNCVIGHKNPMWDAGLDHIHTTHIDQIITVLLES